MTDFKNLVQNRRSHRNFAHAEISPEDLQTILRAALMSPTSKNQRNWKFVVVEDPELLQKLSEAKDAGAAFIAKAPIAVVVLGNSTENDCWIEDASIAAITMQYQAEELGIGSCWAQMRGRGLSDGVSANEVIRGLLNIPENYSVLCVVAFGLKCDERKPQNEEKLKWGQVQVGPF